MRTDQRADPIYREAEALYGALWQPGSGRISDAAEVDVSPDGRCAVFTGTVVESVAGRSPTRICRIDLESGETRVLTSGPGVDRLPKFSPDGRHLAFLSDRHRPGDFQLYVMNFGDRAIRSCASVDGWVEYFHWSPDGTRILLGVAGQDADTPGTHGAVRRSGSTDGLPGWMPIVQTGKQSSKNWRGGWVYDLRADRVRQVSGAGYNVWEVVWLGDTALAAVASHRPEEGFWYSARLYRIDLASGAWDELHEPRDQIGLPAASPSGRFLAVVEAVCSDRWIVAGELYLADATFGRFARVDTNGVDVTCVVWCSEQTLLLAGQRGFETVVGVCDARTRKFVERWRSCEIATAPPFLTVARLAGSGDCVLVGEGFTRAPEIAVVRGDAYKTVRSFDLAYAEEAASIDWVEQVTWTAPDGIEIHGWLVRPSGAGTAPLVMNVHGGPVASWRPMWLGRPRSTPLLMLLKRGYSVFLPNPRGSAGRGREFARLVVGDMGGADTHDYLTGLDHLIHSGRADRAHLAVTGVSYGGFMACWLVTQDPRFAAAVAVAPITNRVSQRLTCSQPHFVDLFLGDKYNDPSGKYVTRSPIMYASRVRTPTLCICGGLDRCTPPDQGVQFYNALQENGVDSGLVIYPGEGHGVRNFPAAIDYAARVVGWFDRYMDV